MTAAVRIAGVGLLTLGVWATGQGRAGRGQMGPGRGLPGRGGTRAPLADPGAPGELFRQARQAIAEVPTLVAPRAMADLARDEARELPDQSLADFDAAFRLALAVPLPQGAEDPAGQARLLLKQNIELEAIGEFGRRGEQDEALTLVRQADVAKGALYDELILLADRPQAGFWRAVARGGVIGDDPAKASASVPESKAEEQQAALDRVFALVQECKRADGTYPYRGVASVLRRPGFDGLERLSLVRDGYQWAANETDATQIAAAAMFLQAGHQVEPALDGTLEPTLLTLLRRVAEDQSTTATGAARNNGNRLMALLQQVDAGEAQRLALELPGVGAQALARAQQQSAQMAISQAQSQAITNQIQSALQAQGVRGGRGGQIRMNVTTQNAAGGTVSMPMTINMTPAPANSEAGDSSGAQQFLALLAQAESLQRKDAAQALGNANQANDLLDDATLANELLPATRLAMLYGQLGANAAAARVLARCLSAADSAAQAVDTNFEAADAAQQAQIAESLDSAQSTVLEVYSLAARLDFGATAVRAAAASFVLLKPLVLARVALVGEVGQGPATTVYFGPGRGGR